MRHARQPVGQYGEALRLGNHSDVDIDAEPLFQPVGEPHRRDGVSAQAEEILVRFHLIAEYFTGGRDHEGQEGFSAVMVHGRNLSDDKRRLVTAVVSETI